MTPTLSLLRRGASKIRPLMLDCSAAAPASEQVSLLGRTMGVSMTAPVRISAVLCSHNRREVLKNTLTRLQTVWPHAEELEILVVDNASQDGSADMVRQCFPRVRLYEMERNRGAVARNVGLAQARGQFVLLLDDDSFPIASCMKRMIEHFQADPRLGAAVFNVTLPDGSRECSAYPDVFIGCGTAFRRRALDQAGLLPEDFFMQAEEYDLSLRLIEGGWHVRRFNDLHVLHMKTPQARRPDDVMRLDTRNNLLLVIRRFPWRWMLPYGLDWMRRYWWIAQANGQNAAFRRGLLEGLLQAACTPRRAISSQTFETFAKVQETERRMRQTKADLKLRTIILIDCGKNLPAYYMAARACGLRVLAIADSRMAAVGRRYRNIPIVTDEAARRMIFDAAIVANLSPVHAGRRRAQWRRWHERPIIDLFASGAEAAVTGGADRAAWEARRTVARSA
jgi:GT2 family glycosyltransferase